MSTTIDVRKGNREREKIVKEIAKTSDAIRKKHRALMTGKFDEDVALERHFRPIIEPLQKIVENPGTIVVKNESDSNDIDAPIDALSIKKRKIEEKDDPTLKKKIKQLYTSLDRPTLTPHRSSESPRTKGSIASTKVTRVTSTPIATAKQSTIPEFQAEENVFETTDDSFATTVRNKLQTLEGREALENQLGSLSQKYINAVLYNETGIDKTYGVRLTNDGMMLGNKRFDVDRDNNIFLDNVRFIGTPGLYELIFKKIPDDDVYTEADKQTYKSIMMMTNAYKHNYDAHDRIKSNRGYKYKHLIAPLLSIEPKKKSGKGLFMPHTMTLHEGNKIDYVHWDDPNELVDRLRLLNASRQAGNNAHDNEIMSIIEELREAGIIIN